MFFYKRLKFNSLRISKLAFILLLLISTSSLNASSLMPEEKSTSFPKDRIIRFATRPPNFSDEQIIELIRENKVSFETTPTIEQEFITAGVSPAIVAACKENYLAPKKATPTPQPSPNPVIEDDNPLSKEEIIDLLKKKVLPAKIEKAVEDRGVNFNIDPATSNEIKLAGGSNSLIGAIASRYVAVNTNPLTKAEILDMLKKKVALAKIENTVEKRGVSFNIDPATSNEIKLAGGSNSLIGAIASRYVATNTNNNSASNSASSSVTTASASVQAVEAYFRVLDQSILAIKAKNFPLAISEAQKAVSINDKLPQAHYLLGFVNLSSGNVGEAARHYRSALDRGGEVSFVVINDRKDVSDKAFMALEGAGVSGILRKIPGMDRSPAPRQSTASTPFLDSCKGALFISKNRVKFQADDNKNSFDVQMPLIVEADINKSYGKDKFAFHLKVKDKGDEKKNYNFAMESGFNAGGRIDKFTVDQTNLAINLITTEKTRVTK